MAFVLDDAFLPATLSAAPMTDEEFLTFCQEHEDLVFETNAQGELEVMPPTAPLSGDRNMGIGAQLWNWAKKDKRGRTYDSSSMFVLPNGARRSPDAAFILKSRLAQIGPFQVENLWHICPDFVVELRSASDRPHRLRTKMEEYSANGAGLGWLIDPKQKSVTIFRPNREPETLTSIDSIKGEPPVEGFVLDLDEVWDPLGN